MGYIFGGNTGETAESLARKRKVIEALLLQRDPAPDTIGGGIASVMQAISGRMGKAALDRDAAKGRQASNSAFNDYLGTMSPAGEISGAGGVDAVTGSGGGDYFSKIRAAESGGNDAAKNPTSSATGRYQFIKSTWDELARTKPELGLTPDGRSDPAQQEKAIRAFTADNARILASAGIEPTGGNLYAAHFLGSGGAKNVLSQPDGASVASIVGPGVVQANSFLAGMSVGDFKRWAASKGGNNVLEGGEGDDQLRETWGQPDPQRFGHGINTQTGAPASFDAPDPARFGPTTAPKGDRLTPPMQAQGPLTLEGVPMPTMGQPPAKQNLQVATAPASPPRVDPMKTASVPQQRPRGIMSPRSDDAGYRYGPGGQYSRAGEMPASPQQNVVQAILSRQGAGTPAPAEAAYSAPAGGGNGGGMGIDPRALAILNDPYASDEQKAVVQAILERKMKEADPEYNLDLDLKRAQLEKARAPEAGPEQPADVREYEYARGQGYKGTFTEWQTKGVRDQEVGFSREQGLRKEYTASPEYKRFDDVRASFERVRASAQRDSGAGDLGLIFGFMKMLDPGSVVREGEFANAQNTAGVPDRIRNLYNSVVNGERLQPGQRQEFVATAGDLYQQEANRIGSVNERYTGIAKGYEIDPGRIIVTPQQYEPLDLGQAPPPTAGSVGDANQDGIIDYRDYFGRR